MDELGADTIPYTFRLEETLAATNLPAWPALDTQLFSSVELRYSTDGPDGPYLSDDMDAVPGTKNGSVVWEKSLGIPASGSVYYYFEVVLAEPLLFTALDRNFLTRDMDEDGMPDLDPTTLTLDQVFDEANLHQIPINRWAMPDPRNLQLVDRGILDKLFTPDLITEFSSILDSPQVIDIALKVFAGQQIDINAILNVATPKQLRRIQNILLRNTNELTTQFEDDFDPLLASVFSVPDVDLEKYSLWTARIDNIDDGNYQLKADVLDADGTVRHRIQENITVDTSAPEGGVNIGLGENVTGYQNGDVFIATAPTAGTPALLNISGTATDVGPGVGYLFYQIIGLNADGTPYLGEPSLESPNTWMPLTVKSGIVASRIWNTIVEGSTDEEIASVLRGLVNAGVFNLPPGLDISVLDDATIANLLRAQTLEGLLSTYLTVENIQGPVDEFLKGLEPFIGFSSLSDSQYQLIVAALGATVDIIDRLVPVTFNPSDHVVMPIQGEGMALIVGDYGIRALGIDTHFNVGAYAAPTHLRIVSPGTNIDRASIVDANIGDFNNDGMVHPEYETRIIYENTKNVMITGTVTQKHPIQSVVIQYKDASDNWVNIGEATVMGADFEYTWNVDDFDALISAGDTVMVRAKATNALQLPEA